MSKPKCPKCGREATYSAKYDQCSACGRGYEATNASPIPRLSRSVGGVTPSEAERGDANFAPEAQVGEALVAPSPGEVCPQCHERKPSEAALKQREWRERKKGNG